MMYPQKDSNDYIIALWRKNNKWTHEPERTSSTLQFKRRDWLRGRTSPSGSCGYCHSIEIPRPRPNFEPRCFEFTKAQICIRVGAWGLGTDNNFENNLQRHSTILGSDSWSHACIYLQVTIWNTGITSFQQQDVSLLKSHHPIVKIAFKT